MPPAGFCGVETPPPLPYAHLMDSPTDPIDAPPEWIASLLASRAEIDRGERVPMEPVLARMQAAIHRIEARRAAKHSKAT
jgi:hypothetical protein